MMLDVIFFYSFIDSYKNAKELYHGSLYTLFHKQVLIIFPKSINQFYTYVNEYLDEHK